MPKNETHLGIDASREQKVLLVRVEVKPSDSTSVFIVPENARFVGTATSVPLFILSSEAAHPAPDRILAGS